MHDVILAFEAHLASGLDRRFRTELIEVPEAHDLSFDEALLEIRVDHAGSFGSGPTLLDRPAARFLRTCRQIALETKSVVPDAGQDVEAGLVDAHLGEELTSFLLVHLDDFRFELCVEEDRLSGCHNLGHPLLEGLVREFLLRAVEDIDVRLGGEEVEIVDLIEIDAGVADALPTLQRILGCGVCLQLGAHLLLDPRFFLNTRQRFLDGLEVSEDQLGGDGVDVVGGVDLTVDVEDVIVLEHTSDLADRISLTNVGKEGVAHALTLGGALHDARDVDEADRGRENLLGTVDLSETREPLVGNADHAHVRLDRRERIIRSEHVVAGQCVEQGRLAGVGKADDSN